MLKSMTYITKELLLQSCQQIASLRRTVILIFSGSTPDDHDRCIRLSGCLRRQFFIYGHLLLIPGFHGPAFSHIKGMLLQPLTVHLLQRFIYLNAYVFFQAVDDIRDIRSIDHAAGACSALVMLKLRSSEDRYPLPFLQRQHTVFISKQYASLCCHSSCQFRIFLIIQGIFHTFVCSFPILSVFLSAPETYFMFLCACSFYPIMITLIS